MRYSLLSAVAMGFSALAGATFTSPKAGDSWVLGQENTISWDSKSTSGLSDISCVPAGAKDTTVIIAQIATQIDSSSGSFKWTPDKSISAQSVTIIIVDSKKSFTVSETLILISEESSNSNSKGSGKDGKDGKNNGNDYNSGKNNGNDYNPGKNNGNDYNSGKGKNSTETKSSESEKTKSYESMATHTMKSNNNSTKETKSMGSEMTKSMGNEMTKSKDSGMTQSKDSGMKTESMGMGQQVTNSIIIAISTGTVATQTEAPAAVTQTSVAQLSSFVMTSRAAGETTTKAASTAAIVAANTSSLFLATGTGSGQARPSTSFQGGASSGTVGSTVAGGLFGLMVAFFL